MLPGAHLRRHGVEAQLRNAQLGAILPARLSSGQNLLGTDGVQRVQVTCGTSGTGDIGEGALGTGRGRLVHDARPAPGALRDVVACARRRGGSTLPPLIRSRTASNAMLLPPRSLCSGCGCLHGHPKGFMPLT